MTLIELKSEIIKDYQESLQEAVLEIAGKAITHQDKAKEVNSLIAQHRLRLRDALLNGDNGVSKQQSLLVLEYCTSVVSLEYRHSVWPYEYMALSRRVGELWERFCCSAWDHPSRENVSRVIPPQFVDVARELHARVIEATSAMPKREDVLRDVDTLLQLVGEINMMEDEVFTVDGIPHVIDFKSGFGSNEKGNMIRLQTVGKAYKLWNPDTRLLFLVRQDENNNYLRVIQQAGLWEVRCGDAAYATIDELTGSSMLEIRRDVINFRSDLSAHFWADMGAQLSDLSKYLNW